VKWGNNQSTPAKKRQSSIVGTVIHLAISIILLNLLAWMLLSTGFGLYQLMQGEEKASRQINNIIVANQNLLKGGNHFLIGNAYNVFESEEKDLLEAVLVKTDLLDAWQGANAKIQEVKRLVEQKSPPLNRVTTQTGEHVFYPLCQVFMEVGIVTSMRLFIFILALPLFLLCVGLGCIDGLVQRDIRKFQGARESTYLFHRIKMTWKSLFFVPIFLYFVCPLVIHPLWFFLPLAVTLGLMMQIGLRSFKKYV
jgi:integrating conjugative element membrane protein (TIGR03747 family)